MLTSSFGLFVFFVGEDFEEIFFLVGKFVDLCGARDVVSDSFEVFFVFWF